MLHLNVFIRDLNLQLSFILIGCPTQDKESYLIYYFTHNRRKKKRDGFKFFPQGINVMWTRNASVGIWTRLADFIKAFTLVRTHTHSTYTHIHARTHTYLGYKKLSYPLENLHISSVGLTVPWLYLLQRSKTSSKRSVLVMILNCIWGVSSIPILPLFPGTLWPGVVVLIINIIFKQLYLTYDILYIYIYIYNVHYKSIWPIDFYL